LYGNKDITICIIAWKKTYNIDHKKKITDSTNMPIYRRKGDDNAACGSQYKNSNRIHKNTPVVNNIRWHNSGKGWQDINYIRTEWKRDAIWIK